MVQLGPDAHKVRRHQPSDAVLVVTKQLRSDRALLRRKRVQQMLCRFGRQFLQQARSGRPATWRSTCSHDFLVRHGPQQLLLPFLRQVGEDRRGLFTRQQPEDDCFLLGG